ncbi:PA0069 family radical SAM protein [Jiulongibacter sp. NS-SX5]|uniref:PA0069 family radical SAM protein n=1 Tax=Jiulongibacter sp. NS-SX5 TaxID=3463854 RepID=UPI004058B922
MSENTKIKGRGAQLNTVNKFNALTVEFDDEFAFGEEQNFRTSKTTFLREHPKNIVNKVKSPDLPMAFSVNPYQGCEHGCVYCYARNTHEYFGYSAGLEFEQKIIVKENAPELLEKAFLRKSWKPETVLFSGNTDCYQPAEKKFLLTRKMLEVCLKYKNPAAIITKNALILRDLDLLAELAKDNLIKVIISITTLNEELRRNLEPRTVSAVRRLQILAKLKEAEVPVGVNIAPIIPGLNDHEIPQIAKESAKHGADWIAYTTVRLNGSIGPLFEDWIKSAYPNKAYKVLKQIKEMHGGSLNDSVFGRRMRGEGRYAEHIRQLFHLSKARYFGEVEVKELNKAAFQKPGQLNLF